MYPKEDTSSDFQGSRLMSPVKTYTKHMDINAHIGKRWAAV